MIPSVRLSAGSSDAARGRAFVRGAYHRFFLPSVISSFWLAVAGVVDSAFIGNAVGASGLAAVSLGQPVYLFYNILSYGFSIGGSIHYASRLAEGREEEGNQIFRTILRFLLALYIVTAALGLLFLPRLTVLLGADPADGITRTYIRTQLLFVPIMFCQGPFYYFVNADNAPKLAASALSISGLLDTLFSYIFIVRMRLGVAGSVYSTVLGALVMLGITSTHILRRRGALRLGLGRMDWRAVYLSARTGFSTSVRYLFEFITMIAVNHLLMRLSGAVAVAAFDVVYNISVLCASFTEGTNTAIEPMLSSYWSERNLGNVRDTLRLALLSAGSLAVLTSVLFFAFSPWASAVFGMNEGVGMAYTVQGIRIYALSNLAAAVNVIFGGYYQSIMREWLSYLITFLRSFVFYLLSLFIFAGMGIDAFWFVFLTSELLTILVWMPLAALRGGICQFHQVDMERVCSRIIESTGDRLGAAVESVQAFCAEHLDDARLLMYIGLTIEEICCAIIDHFPDRAGEIYVQVTVVAGDDGCTLYLRDNAMKYNPLGSDTGQIDLMSGERLELVGVRIIQKRAREFYYRHYSGFNTLVIRL